MKVKLSICLAIILIVLTFPITILAAETSGNYSADHVFIYMIDKLNINDIDPNITPNLWSLKEKGGMGLLNTVTGGGRTTKNTCCTISAGKPAVASSKAQLNFKAAEIIDLEKAGDIFYRNTGIPTVDDNIVINSIEVIEKNNERLNIGEPGKLGDAIHTMGYSTAVIGDSDRPGFYSRPGALVLMNSQGIIDNGFVGKEVHDTTGLVYWSNYSQILEQSKKLKDIPSVILIEFGDLSRLDSMYKLFSPVRYQEERKQILSQIDTCIGEIQEKVATNRTCVYLITPSPSMTAVMSNALLTPLIIVKPGFEGTLTSYSTRREGVVHSVNIKNSILNCLNPDINEEIYTLKTGKSIRDLQELNKRAGFNYSNQAWIMSIYVFLILSLLLLVLLQSILKKDNNFTRIILIFLIALPLSLLIMSNINVLNRSLFIIESLGINVIITLITWAIARVFKINALLPVLLVSIAVITFDLIADTGLIKNSIMSYQLLSGIRYYGLGNEYMGVLLGATISFSALILQNSPSRKRQVLITILFCCITLLIAYPLFGINVGGAITASLGLGYTFLRFKQYNINTKKIILLLVSTVIFISIMAVIDINQPLEFQSHLGKNISLIINGGIGEALSIVVRKLQMHLRVINYTFWGWVLLFIIFVLTYQIFKPKQWLEKLSAHFPIVYTGLQGILSTAVIAILFNDSGIVAAAILFLYFLVLLFYSLIELNKRLEQN